MKVTIKDIARIAEVSTTTVSKIINNKDGNISNATRERVLKIMDDYNYTPNKIAQSLVTKKTNTIGLIIPDIRNPFFPELARGAEDKANEEGYNLIFCNTDDDIEKEEKYINMLVEKMVDGIVFTASSKKHTGFENFKKFSIPIVLVDRDIDVEGIQGKVIVDNFIGGYEAGKHLLKLGHTEIIFLSGPLKSNTSINRLNGYKKALHEFNIDLKEEYILEGYYRSEWGYEATMDLLNKDKKFTALFCANDLIAIGAIKALKEKNIKIPQEISIVGFDDIYMARLIDPELTTIKQPNYEMGYKSVEILINILEDKKENNKNINLKPELVIRKSTLKR